MSDEDSEGPFGDNPGKKRSGKPDDWSEPTIIENLDSKNAMRLRFVEGLSERVIELAEEIQKNTIKDDGAPIEIPLGRVGVGLFEVYTMTVSFFESASWILADWALQVDVPARDDFIDFYRNESDSNVLEGCTTRDEEINAVSDYLRENGTSYEIIEMFSYANVIDADMVDTLHQVRMSRNEYIHNPLRFRQVRSDDEVLSMIAECVTVIEEVENLLQNELPVDDAFYSMFPKDDSS
jgi:predicted transcriptional regulator